jgi:hypothetical protein
MTPAVAAAALAAGCLAPAPTPGPTFEPGTEAIPGPGWVRITTDPAILGRPVSFRLAGSEGVPGAQEGRVAAGEPVDTSLIALPGPMTVMVDDRACAGAAPVTTGLVTWVVVRVNVHDCSITVVGIAPR